MIEKAKRRIRLILVAVIVTAVILYFGKNDVIYLHVNISVIIKVCYSIDYSMRGSKLQHYDAWIAKTVNVHCTNLLLRIIYIKIACVVLVLRLT